MAAALGSLLHTLALSESSGTTDFLGQVSGLLILTCIAGAIWVALMALVFQRASERRRRAAQGLEPLPSLPVAFYQRLTGPKRPRPTPALPPDAAMPLPDLGMLTGGLAGEILRPARAADPSPRPAQPAPTPPPDETAEGETPFMAAEDEQPPADTPSGDVVELLRVYRDLADGGLIVAIGDRQFRSLAELRSADLARRFENVMRDLDALAHPQPAAPARASQDRDMPTDEIAPPRERSMLRQVTRLAMGQPVETPLEQPELSIADQIEDLLQERLREMPQFAGRTIHVRPALSGGVQIEVDGKFYEGVGDIDDEEVRALLMAVVREWEESH
ncbi:MAG: hypothetical protein AB1435_08020 [Chloroflexota bacterium]